MALTQKLVYETGTAEATTLLVESHQVLVHGAAIEIVRSDLLFDGSWKQERIVLTIPEALQLIGHLTACVANALMGDDNFCPAESASD